MRRIALAALLSVSFVWPLGSGCAVVAGAAVGSAATSSAMDSSIYVGQLTNNADMTWAQSKVALSNLSLKPIGYDNEARRATAEVDDATVIVEVATYDLNKSELRVSAKRWYGPDGKIAKMVFDKIVADLDVKAR
jgi:hypothetical protein